MVLPTVGWAFLHQVLMKTVPHRCAPKVNMTWAIPQLRTPFHVTRGCVKLTKQTRTHISHRGQSRCCETYPNSIWQRGEIFVGPCTSKRWVLVLSWHSFASFFNSLWDASPWGVPSIWKESFLSVKLDWKLPCRPWVHYGPSCLISDLTDREVHHHHHKQRLSYSHLQRFFFFWQCSPLES